MTGNEVTTLDLELAPYHLFNVNTGLVYDDWDVMFYIKNIGDENPQFSFDRGTWWPSTSGLSGRATSHVRHPQPVLFLAGALELRDAKPSKGLFSDAIQVTEHHGQIVTSHRHLPVLLTPHSVNE